MEDKILSFDSNGNYIFKNQLDELDYEGKNVKVKEDWDKYKGSYESDKNKSDKQPVAFDLNSLRKMVNKKSDSVDETAPIDSHNTESIIVKETVEIKQQADKVEISPTAEVEEIVANEVNAEVQESPKEDESPMEDKTVEHSKQTAFNLKSVMSNLSTSAKAGKEDKSDMELKTLELSSNNTSTITKTDEVVIDGVNYRIVSLELFSGDYGVERLNHWLSKVTKKWSQNPGGCFENKDNKGMYTRYITFINKNNVSRIYYVLSKENNISAAVFNTITKTWGDASSQLVYSDGIVTLAGKIIAFVGVRPAGVMSI